ncbi:MAG: hypothetical protein E6K13_00180 [Methanobacteriota archaeon]|nr:MAG: hypothetical protein E6K13_00180 [Euryarchaeota archaeon]
MGGAAAGWMNLTLPPGFGYVADNGSFPVDVTSGHVAWTVASLAPGTVAPLGVRLRAPLARGTASAQFTFDYTDGRGSPVVSLVSELTSIEIAPLTEFSPALAVDRSVAEHGDEVLATMYFNNTGSAAARTASANWTLSGDYALIDLSPVTSSTPTANGFEVGWANLAVGPHSLVARLRVVRGLADGLAMPIQVRWTATDGDGSPLPPATLAASVVLGFGYVADNASFPTAVAGRQVTWTVASLAAGSVSWLGVHLRGPVARGTASLRFAFDYTDGRGSAVVSILTGGTLVEIAPVTEFAPALAVDRRSAEDGDEMLATLYFNNTGAASARTASASWALGGHYLLVNLSSGTPSTSTPNGFDVSWADVTVGSHLLVARLRVVRALVDGLAMPIQVRWAATDGNGDALPPVTLNASVDLRAPGAAVELAPATLGVVSGSSFAVNVTLRNTGSRPATGWLNVTLSANLAYDSDNGTLVRKLEGGKVTWTVASLRAGSTIYLAVRFRASGTGGSSSLRFTFDFTDGRGSPVGSIVSPPASVEIAGLIAPFPIGAAGVGLALLAVAVAAGIIALRRRRGRGELVIDDVFVVNDGGVLLAHRSSSLVQYQDQDILVGMFKVVQEFVKDSFSKGVDEDMKGLEFGERRIMIEKGQHHFIAVVHRGSESAELRERVRKVSEEIDAKFGDTLARWKGLMEQVQGIANLLPQVWGRQE